MSGLRQRGRANAPGQVGGAPSKGVRGMQAVWSHARVVVWPQASGRSGVRLSVSRRGKEMPMTYRIEGLDPAGIDTSHARRVTVTDKPGFPCRVTLEDAEPGEEVLLL